MAKYDPLYGFLKPFIGDLTISFADVARIIGCRKLPDSAYKRPAWWGNEKPTGKSHVHSRAWMNAGYKADADLQKQEVTFRKLRKSVLIETAD